MMIAAGRVHTSNGICLGGDQRVAILTMGSLVTADVCACVHKVIGQSRVSFLRSFPLTGLQLCIHLGWLTSDSRNVFVSTSFWG